MRIRVSFLLGFKDGGLPVLGDIVSPHFLVTHLLYHGNTKNQVLFQKNLTNVRGVRFTQSPLQKQKGEPPLTLFPYHKLLKVSIVSSVFIPPPDFPEPPELLLPLFLPELAATAACAAEIVAEVPSPYPGI